MANNLYLSKLPEGVKLPDNHYLLSGKLAAKEGDEVINLYDGLMVGNPFVLLPSSEPEKLLYGYCCTDASPNVSGTKDTKKALGLPDDWKPEGERWWIFPIHMTQSGSGDWIKHPSPVGAVLKQVLEMEKPYIATIRWGVPAVNCRQYLSGKSEIGKYAGEELSPRELETLLNSIVEFAASTLIPPNLDAVKAFCAGQKAGSSYSKPETIADRVVFRLNWVKSPENMALVASFSEDSGLDLYSALTLLLT